MVTIENVYPNDDDYHYGYHYLNYRCVQAEKTEEEPLKDSFPLTLATQKTGQIIV